MKDWGNISNLNGALKKSTSIINPDVVSYSYQEMSFAPILLLQVYFIGWHNQLVNWRTMKEGIKDT